MWITVTKLGEILEPTFWKKDIQPHRGKIPKQKKLKDVSLPKMVEKETITRGCPRANSRNTYRYGEKKKKRKKKITNKSSHSEQAETKGEGSYRRVQRRREQHDITERQPEQPSSL